MTKSMEPPFIVTLKPSKILGRAVIAAHGLAIAASLANALPFLYKTVLLAVLAGHLVHAVKSLNNGLPVLRYTDASGWQMAEDNEFEPVEILKSTVVTTFAIWLHVRGRSAAGFFAKIKKTVLIPYDALDENDYRRLIVRLKTTVGD